jgi:hypothetical protein
MTSYEYFVEFNNLPTDLDNFLKQQGYDLENEDKEGVKTYQSKKDKPIDLFYFPKVIQADEEYVPNWSKSKFKIQAELMISTKEFDEIEETHELAKKTVKNYNAIFYDSNLNDFFTSSEL